MSERLFFTFAVLVYAGFSRPAPAIPGLAELLVAVCLGGMVVSHVISYGISRNGLLAAGVIWMMMVAGWCQTIRMAHPTALWVRDLVPVTGWMIPVLLWKPKNTTSYHNSFLAGVGGLIMAVRFWAGAPGLVPGTYNGWPDYLANDPLLWTGGLWWIAQALRAEKLHPLLRIGAALLAIVCTTTVLMTMQRAVLGLAGIAVVGMAWRVRGRIWLFGGLLAVMAMIILLPETQKILALIWQKLQLGWNSRDLEWGVLVNMVRTNPAHLWFGHGWGSSFPSPAVAEWRVTYVHSLAGYLFFKLGVIGLVFFSAIMAFCLGILWRLWQQGGRGQMLMFLPGVLVPCLLSTAFKFPGWIIVLILVLTTNHPAPAAKA